MRSKRRQADRALEKLQCLAARDNLAREFDPDYTGASSFTRREMEMLRGAERVARLELGDRSVPSDAEEGPKISAEERAKRDEYRKHVVNWSKRDVK
jgi:hypothetical protein